jgi:hypothetical protein
LCRRFGSTPGTAQKSRRFDPGAKRACRPEKERQGLGNQSVARLRDDFLAQAPMVDAIVERCDIRQNDVCVLRVLERPALKLRTSLEAAIKIR